MAARRPPRRHDLGTRSRRHVPVRIGGRARIEMGNTGRNAEEVQNDAKDTALVLRSGALPARLNFLEERVIGPALGADAIRAGSYSLLGGIVMVFLFMGIYYRTSGCREGGPPRAMCDPDDDRGPTAAAAPTGPGPITVVASCGAVSTVVGSAAR